MNDDTIRLPPDPIPDGGSSEGGCGEAIGKGMSGLMLLTIVLMLLEDCGFL